jgi:hypothetical protein
MRLCDPRSAPARDFRLFNPGGFLYNPDSLTQQGIVFKEGVAVKGMWTFLQTCLVFLCTVAVVLAEEAAKAEVKEDPYQAIYYIWYALIGIILAWGVYDSFFRPVD